MAIYKRQYFDNANITTAALGTFLTDGGWEYTVSGDVTTITLSENVSFILTKGLAGYNYIDFSISINGTVSLARRCNRYFTLVSCKSDGFSFLEAYSGYDGNRACLVHEVISNEEYVGYAGNNQSSYYNLSDISLTKISDSSIFTHGTVLGYSVPSGSIDYLDSDILFLSGVKSILDPHVKACSNMSSNNVITINGKNYFVISSHSLFAYDN